MKMHKNAGKAAKAQGNKVGPRSFLSFDKNDRQMMANLSEIGGRRYLHLKKVIIIPFQFNNRFTFPNGYLRPRNRWIFKKLFV